MSILEIKNLSKSFDKEKVINHLNLSIEPGIIFGLVGPNGAGKSTTIDCIMDILNFEEGQITVFERDSRKGALYIKKKSALFLENNDDLFIHLTGTEHLQFVGELYGLDRVEIKKRIEILVEYFDLLDMQHKLIRTYSKGTKKKLSLASILIHNPDFIILDEPFDGLDSITVIKLKKLIKILKEKGKTLLVTSHILSYIEDIADEVAIINKGEIIFQSETKNIRNKIKNKMTQQTYASLEDIFVDLLKNDEKAEQELYWL